MMIMSEIIWMLNLLFKLYNNNSERHAHKHATYKQEIRPEWL